MAQWCLTKDAQAKLMEALKNDGDPQKMVDRGSEARLAWFSKVIGPENAREINALFESKMLLKSQVNGFKSFVKSLGGPKQVQRDFISKVERLDKALSESEVEQYLADYVSKKLGIEPLSEEQYKTITALLEKSQTLKEAYDPKTETWTSKEAKAKYGASRVVFEKYVAELKGGKYTLGNIARQNVGEIKSAFSESISKGVLVSLEKTIRTISDNSIGLVATLDNSFLGRQGLHTLMTHPTKWFPAAVRSFTDFAKTLKNTEAAQDALWADIYSSPNYLNGSYDKAKLIPQTEEQYPSQLPEKIPGVGRVFKASEVAFSGSGIRMRTGLFDLLSDQAKKNGVVMNDIQIKDNGTLINSLTARGKLPLESKSGVLQLIFWAPKMLKGNYDVLTGHTLGAGLKTPFARKQAAINWIKIIGLSGLIMSIANAIKKGSAETDPTSSDFGTVKIGNTRIDYTGGARSLVTLAARIITGHYKSSTTGEIIEYGSGYGQTSRFDAFIQFLVGKETPPVSVITDFLKGKNFQGKPPTLKDEIYRAFTPISIKNTINLKDNYSADQMIGVITDILGLSSNSYQDSNAKSGIIPENTRMSNQTFIDSVINYAKAMQTDPETAFNRIFTGQKIKKVTNGTVIVERMPLEASQKVKKAGNANNPAMKLDHTIPLGLGGSNGSDNLKLVTTSQWASYTKVENALISALKAGKISGSEAQNQIKKFKSISDTAQRKTYGDIIINKYK
jgi:hypothetical protein